MVVMVGEGTMSLPVGEALNEKTALEARKGKSRTGMNEVDSRLVIPRF